MDLFTLFSLSGITPPDNSDFSDVFSFVDFFVETFISPFFTIIWSTKVLGFSLAYWFFGATVVSMAVNFVLELLGFDDSKK